MVRLVGAVLCLAVAALLPLTSAQPGTAVWTYAVASTNFASPAVWNNFVVIGDEGTTAAITAVNAATGQLEWSYPHALAADFRAGVNPSGVIYTSGFAGYNNEFESVVALDASTGVLQWSVNVDNYGQMMASPVYGNGNIYCQLYDGSVMALNAEGGMLWAVAPIGSSYTNCCESAPLLATPTLLVAVINQTACGLDPATGLVLWKQSLGGWSPSGASYWNGMIYTGMMNGFALSATTGAIIFQINGLRIGRHAVVDGVLYGSFISGQLLCAFDATTGGQLWCAPGAGGPTSPAVSNGVVYSFTMSGMLYAVNASNGGVLWTYSASCPDTCESDPLVANGMVYIGTGAGLVAVTAS